MSQHPFLEHDRPFSRLGQTMAFRPRAVVKKESGHDIRCRMGIQKISISILLKPVLRQ